MYIEDLCGFMAVASNFAQYLGSTCLFFAGKDSASRPDPSAELSKLGELVQETTEAGEADSAAPPDLQVDAPGDSPTQEPSQESSPGEVQGQGLVSQSSVS